MDAVVEHVWQSTWFALAAAVLALLARKEAARFRYRLWLAASLKFLVPFSLLTWLGARWEIQINDAPALLPLVQHVAAPLTTATVDIQPVGLDAQRWLIAIWALVSVALLMRWLIRWIEVRLIVRRAQMCDVRAHIPVQSSIEIEEPCIVGILNPVLLLPSGLASHLTAQQLHAVIAHEMWHVRRRDNLVSAIHAVIEAIFWFHPLVWWIGARLIVEREHACDEGAIEEGSEPAAYAEAILRVCKHSVTSRSACAAQATEGDLAARIHSILAERNASRFSLVRRAFLTLTMSCCIVLPVAAGVKIVATKVVSVAEGARLVRVSDGATPTFIATDRDSVYARNVSLRELISHVYAVKIRDVGGDDRWLDHARYDIELRAPHGTNEDTHTLVAELLAEQFNIELIVRPAPQIRDRERDS